METHDTPYIGNRWDALTLLDELLENTTLQQAVREALEALRDALEREIV
jgi:20S proteasome alpha/beta subunit